MDKSAKISPELLQKNVDYMADGIGYVIDTFEKRFAGSKGERDAQKYFVHELESKCGCDKVVEEEFQVHPNSFMDWMYLTGSLLYLSLVAYFFIPLVSIVLVVLALIPVVANLLLYKEWMDKLYKKATSSNVFGVVKPSGEVKRRVILCGHTDAAMEWTWHKLFGVKGIVAVAAGSLIGAGYMVATSIMAIINEGMITFMADTSTTAFILGIIGIAFVPFWVALFFYSNKHQVVDGANDNLSANFVACAVPKIFKEAGIQLENTELCALLTGSEEIGLRGAKAFARVHKQEFSDVETIILNIETLREMQELGIYTKDLNGTVKTDLDVAALVKKAGEKNGVDLKYGTVSLGSTDAAAFAQEGYKATCLAAMSHNLKDYYHTRRDTKDNIDPAVMSKALQIMIDSVLMYDEKGLEV